MKPYSRLIVYYFSGTGNSKNVATWLSEVAIERNMNFELYNISEFNNQPIRSPSPDTLLTFVSPIHGFNYPTNVLKFILRFPKGKNNVLLLNTRGGLLAGKKIIPGVTGIAFYLSACILIIKSHSIKAMFPVNLPSNWTFIHPGLKLEAVTYMHIKNKERIRNFASKVFDGESNYRSMYEIVQDLIVAPVSILYFFIGRFFFTKTYLASRECDHCNICINNCPKKAIIKIANRPFWTFKCENCMKCIANCPQKAIQITHGLFTLYILLFFVFFINTFFFYFEMYIFEVENLLVKNIIKTGLCLSLFAAWYRLIHYLIRFTFFERIMSYTSLTKLRFWRRYKALKNI
ncbi:MAG: EFR1 family ferrodoxin [Bacteroidales bacterium]|jgi:ferredoxin|nr:EFR1 family ferrodoxin [Bacteroidales bacterium]